MLAYTDLTELFNDCSQTETALPANDIDFICCRSKDGAVLRAVEDVRAQHDGGVKTPRDERSGDVSCHKICSQDCLSNRPEYLTFGWVDALCVVRVYRQSGNARVGNTSISRRGAGRYIRFDPWAWLSLQRAQA